MRYGGGNRSRLLFIILIVTALFLITLDLRGVSLISGLKSGTQTILNPFQRAGNAVISPIRNFASDITHLGRTRNEIAQLKEENQRLREKLINRKDADGKLKQLEGVLNLAGNAGFKTVSAKVISYGSGASFSQTLTIDAGTSSGVRKNMSVISSAGLVGVVKASFPRSAIVQLACDPEFKIGARIAGSQQLGILTGQGTRKGALQLLDNLTTVKKGDVLLARGSNNGRPFVPGVPIGVVTAVDNSAGSASQTADVKYYVNFTALGVVSVVVSGEGADPRDALVPPKPRPTPTPTVTIYATPSPTASNG